MTKLAFFGHDASDSAVARRMSSFARDGLEAHGFTMRRDEAQDREFANTDLGRTYDGAFLQRIRQVFKGGRKAADPVHGLHRADVIYARNLDMLACAFLAKRHARLKTPVIYECLDVHRLLVRRDPIGWMMRGLERALLKRSAGLVVSSPAFLRNHFERHYKGLYKSALVENRLPESAPARLSSDRSSARAPGAPLRLGWVGILRCQRSMDLMCALADRFGNKVEIKLHGKPARTEIAVFEPEIEARENMSYAGPYRAPDDLPAIYEGLDLVWAGDFMEAGFNSVWLLPNRIYEGGYYATPPICVADTETASWVTSRQAGFTVAEPLEHTLVELVDQLISERSAIEAARDRLAALPEETFIEPKGILARIVTGFLQAGAHA